MGKSVRRPWSREELIVAFNLYCRIPFGRIHTRNSQIIEVAHSLSRTPSSLAMKMVNFASLDPFHRRRNVKGLSNASNLDRAIWNEFHENWQELAQQSQRMLNLLDTTKEAAYDRLNEKLIAVARTETTAIMKVRLVQSFFRDTILAIYRSRCALCSLPISGLIVASHIIPWSKNAERRADPTNGVALCALHDRAFDRGLIAFDDEYRTVISQKLRTAKSVPLQQVGFIDMEGRKLRLPDRFAPDKSALSYHRERIFERI